MPADLAIHVAYIADDGSRWGFGLAPEPALAMARKALASIYAPHEAQQLAEQQARLRLAEVVVRGIPEEDRVEFIGELMDVDRRLVVEMLGGSDAG